MIFPVAISEKITMLYTSHFVFTVSGIAVEDSNHQTNKQITMMYSNHRTFSRVAVTFHCNTSQEPTRPKPVLTGKPQERINSQH